MTSIAFIFPGQGSQAIKMGYDLYHSSEEAKQIFKKADEILGFSLTDIMFNGPKESLNLTENSQAAIFVTSIALLEALKARYPHLCPSFVGGLSLGEYSALVASGRLGFETALIIVQQRARFMKEACQKTLGAMAALIGASQSAVEKLVQEANMPRDVWIANYNSPNQIVLSGTVKGILHCMQLAKEKKIKAIQLEVQGAFHSGLMCLAQEQLNAVLSSLDIGESTIPILMNVTGSVVSDPELIKRYMGQQVTHSVKWEQTIRAMDNVDLFLEIGHGKVLAGLNQKIKVVAPTLSISNIEEIEKIETYLNSKVTL